MRVFLAGATGAVGRLLLPRLVRAGHQVTALTRTPEGAAAVSASGAAAVIGDVFDAGEVERAVGAAAPDVIVHQLTALGARDFAANSRIRQVGTRNLVDAARAAGTPRMIAQSIAWAYRAGEGPAGEEEPLDVGAAPPRGGTVAGVVALETAVREMPEWVILRYGLLYGPGTWYRRDDLMGALAREGKLAADADVSSFVHVDDAAGAALAALAWPAGVVNVVDDEPAAASEWVPAFCAAVGAGSPPRAGGERSGWARGASNRHARERLSWQPSYPTWRRGFRTL